MSFSAATASPFARFAASAADEMACIAAHVDADSQFAFALSCSAARAAVATLAPPPLALPTRTRTTYTGVIAAASARLATWSVDEGLADIGALARAAVWFDGPVGVDVLEVVRAAALEPDCYSIGRSRAGDVRALDWALARGHVVVWVRDCVAAAAECGHIDVLNWLADHGLRIDVPTAFSNAACQGHVAVLDWLERSGYPHSPDAYPQISLTVLAAHGGHVGVLEWLHARGGCEPWYTACTDACATGQLHALVWLRAHGCPWSTRALTRAAANGHIGVLEWALDNGCPVETMDGELCSQAASSGHIAVLESLRARGYEGNAQSGANAAFHGHLEALKWLHAHGCPWDAFVCTCAVNRDRVDILEWLRANGCPWDARVCTTAFEAGHLKTLKWAVANGCPWDAVACGGDAADCIRRLEQLQPGA
jgi:hypothetical protein